MPSRTETVLEMKLATARSGLPSPLKSPTATDWGCVPTPKVAAGVNDTVWPSAAFGNVGEKNEVAATSSDSLARLLVMSG